MTGKPDWGLAALALVCAIQPACAASPAPAPPANSKVVRFSGDVRRGERFTRAISGDLRFLLEPDPTEGWRIEVVGADSTRDYVWVVTPPYRGVNEAVVQAWHFRNAENSGPNDGSVNAPRDKRGFSFVTSAPDFAKCRDAVDRLLWPDGISDAGLDSAQALLDGVTHGEGTLTIGDMKLGGLGPGQSPWIEAMHFAVELELPEAAAARKP
ncbi:MAG TPA: hypothetical protein VK123_10855 [Candidatus Limnocylindrales bacterium]|nr:hypothetical protein [Candidatus Limnocylindrales bacterium]